MAYSSISLWAWFEDNQYTDEFRTGMVERGFSIEPLEFVRNGRAKNGSWVIGCQVAPGEQVDQESLNALEELLEHRSFLSSFASRAKMWVIVRFYDSEWVSLAFDSKIIARCAEASIGLSFENRS